MTDLRGTGLLPFHWLNPGGTGGLQPECRMDSLVEDGRATTRGAGVCLTMSHYAAMPGPSAWVFFSSEVPALSGFLSAAAEASPSCHRLPVAVGGRVYLFICFELHFKM